MDQRIGDLLARRALTTLVGRRDELAALLECLEPSGPLVCWIYGIAGIGKSSLLHAFVERARERGATIHLLDCRVIEPTEAGVLAVLGALLGQPLRDPSHVGELLSAQGARVVLALDNYEVFRLIDTWLRQRLLPELGAQVRLVLVSREPPPAGWVAGEYAACFASYRLAGLDTAEALSMLRQAGVDDASAERVADWTQGHPLALRLAIAAAPARGRTGGRSGAALADVLLELTRLYLDEVPDAQVRRALEGVAAVRRVTRPLLAALCPDAPADALYEQLAALHFVETRSDGLALHEVVREAIASAVKAADAAQLRRYQRVAWRRLHDEFRRTPPADLWRWTADAIYLIESPVIREAFFPSRSARYSVEPARGGDATNIGAITRSFDAESAAGGIEAWWQALPKAFHVIRDAHGAVAGFYCMAPASQLDPAWLCKDPVAWRWWQHLQDAPRAQRPHALFLRRWLSREQGEAPGPVQAAAWLDIKRSYLELRPALRRVYLTLRNPAPYAAVAHELGFRMIDEAAVDVVDGRYQTAMLDFGPASVDGWICDLVGRELGIEHVGVLDPHARQLVVEGRRVDLTPLEFGTMRLLQQRSGEAVARSALLDEVWGRRYGGGSNVVDSIVRSLRRKLGVHARAVETVRGVGYRYRLDEDEDEEVLAP